MEAKLNIWPLKGRQWFEAVHLDAFLVVSKSSQSSRNVTWLMEVWKNGAVFVDEFHIPVVFGCISQCFSHAPVALRTARLLSIPVPIRFACLKSGNECSHRVTRLQTLRHRVGASLPSVWPLARASTRVSTVRKCADCYKKKLLEPPWWRLELHCDCILADKFNGCLMSRFQTVSEQKKMRPCSTQHPTIESSFHCISLISKRDHVSKKSSCTLPRPS